MPLMHGKSEKAFKHNVEAEMHAGKPQKQSLAIAYAMKRKKKKMADGGDVSPSPYDVFAKGVKEAFNPSSEQAEAAPKKEAAPEDKNPLSRGMKKAFGTPGYAEGGDVDDDDDKMDTISKVAPLAMLALSKGGFIDEEIASGYEAMPEEHEKMDHPAMAEDERMLNQHGEYEVGAEGMDEDNEMQHETMYGHPVENQNDHEDMVGRIMKQRAMHYSKGGRVANDVGMGAAADLEDNQFDDLVKRDDLEFNYTGANSGDELGNMQEDDDRRDIVKRIMKSRAKKDRMPHPA